MKIQCTSFWRPYNVEVNGRVYKVNDINFYDVDEGVVVHNSNGWLSDNDGRDIKSIDLPCDKIIRRNVCKFDGKIFVILGKDYGDTVASLYIPANVFDIHSVGHTVRYNSEYEVFEGNNNIRLFKLKERLDADLQVTEQQIMNLISKDLTSYNLNHNRDTFDSAYDKLGELLKVFDNQRKSLTDRISKVK